MEIDNRHRTDIKDFKGSYHPFGGIITFVVFEGKVTGKLVKLEAHDVICF